MQTQNKKLVSEWDSDYLNPEMQTALIQHLNEEITNGVTIFNKLGETSEEIVAYWVYSKCLAPMGW